MQTKYVIGILFIAFSIYIEFREPEASKAIARSFTGFIQGLFGLGLLAGAIWKFREATQVSQKLTSIATGLVLLVFGTLCIAAALNL